MLVFASNGDNITSPQQALGWVSAVWPTTEALVVSGQRIVYLLNPTVGHLGIFVSGDIARREHRAILECLDSLEELPPGLYEMRIQESVKNADCVDPQYKVSFERRRVEDLPQASTPVAFERVRDLSQQIDVIYQNTLGPWARLVGGPALATTLKWAHPMRVSRLGWAHAFNPFALGVDLAAGWASSRRTPTSTDNPWTVAEARAMDVWSGDWRRRRDGYTEKLFVTLYQRSQDAVEASK